MNADGQFVAYEASGNGYPGASSREPASYGCILRYNLSSGLTELVATNAAVPTAANEDIRSLDMTPDGRFIAFVANTNGIDGSTTCVLLWDAWSNTSKLVSGDVGGQVPLNSTCDWPSLDPLGRYVAFTCGPSNLTANALVGDYHLHLRDTQAGITILLDVDTNNIGSPISAAFLPRFTPDLRFVAFECADGGMVPNDRNHAYDVCLRDLTTGATELISAHDVALPSLSPNGPSFLYANSISADGRYVAFASDADNVAPNDTNGVRDIFVRDLLSGANTLVSIATNSSAADGTSYEPVLTPDGRYVAFTSWADNLVPGDTNKARDVFVRDLQLVTTIMVSVSSDGSTPGNRDSYSPLISTNGQYILFRSLATNIAPAAVRTPNLFLRDLKSGTTSALPTFGVAVYPGGADISMTPDARYVAFANDSSMSYPTHVWDKDTGTNIFDGTLTVAEVSLSPDGRFLLYESNGLRAADLTTKTTFPILTNYYGGRSQPPRFSADSRFCTYAGPPTALYNYTSVYVYDFQERTNTLITRAFGQVCSWPDISADGRFIVYRSGAANLVADTNGVPDIFLFDRQTGTTTLLSSSRLGNRSADGPSLRPFFSGDGQTVFFGSWASDIESTDFNQAADLFVFKLYAPTEFPRFQVTIVPGAVPGRDPWATWPALPGKSYAVQYKDSLGDAVWHDLPGAAWIVGTQGFLMDGPSAPGQRFYRLVAY